jgi:hypothetical protein
MDFGEAVLTGIGVGEGEGVGDLLEAVSVLEPVEVDAVSGLEKCLVLGMAPEINGLGDNGVVLGLDDVAEEGSLARAEVLAFGGFIEGA